MDSQSKVAILAAVITALGGILGAVITTPWNFFGLIERGENPERTVAELQLTTDVFPLAGARRDGCIDQLTGALLERGFEDSGSSDEAAIVRRGAFKASVWCRPDEIVVTVAGRRGSNTAAVASMVERAAADARLTQPQ